MNCISCITSIVQIQIQYFSGFVPVETNPTGSTLRNQMRDIPLRKRVEYEWNMKVYTNIPMNITGTYLL